MRSLLIGNKRIKVIIHQKLEPEDSWDECCFEFKELSKGELSLSRPIDSKVFDKLGYIDIYFYIAGKWKQFRIDDFEPIYEINGQDFIRKMSFVIPADKESNFETNFRIARCC
ncbi:hypothetical protein [Halobacteriovorax sp. HLS]|uniref:hypothetical protein n=1 Tax=Halobacteriovorax sp. HLS TaxID=2234000 RepID=UPI000FDB826D|nr:hypothetical protein [Halobacteriovorax sp. HLS]